MADWEKIESDLEELLRSDGFELVEMQKQLGGGARLTLLVDHLDQPGTMSTDDCADVSRTVSAYLDRADPFKGAYRLQVSSPGVDRPLTRPRHWERAVGQQVRVKHRHGGKPATITGKLTQVDDDAVVVEVGETPVRLPWQDIVRANVVYDWGD